MAQHRRRCPVCRVSYANVSEHLRDVHGVTDKRERRLLNSLQSGRHGGPLCCHEARCRGQMFVRLDRYLTKVHRVMGGRKKAVMNAARRSAIKERLKTVRGEKKSGEAVEGIRLLLHDLRTEVEMLRTREPAEAKGLLEGLLGRFKAVMLGSNPSRRGTSNMNQLVAHVKVFLDYMWGREGAPSRSLRFLSDTERVISWVKELRREKVATTVKHYLIDVKKFLLFLREDDFQQVRLSQIQMLSLERTLKRELAAMGKEVEIHRQEVHVEKSKKLLTAEQLRTFKESAAKEIPESLEMLQKYPCRDYCLRQCVGLLAGYIFTLSGHRKGVLVSLLEKDLHECDKSDDHYVVYVKAHKTAATYGRAKLALTKAEYTWLTDFAKLRPLLPGYSPEVPTLFFNSAGGELEKLGAMVTDVWRKAGVLDVTTTLIRSSLSTLAQRRLEPCQRSQVTRAMCHSNSTSDRYYVGEESVSEAHATRRTLDHALSPPPPLPPSPAAEPRAERMRMASSSVSDCDEPAPAPPPATRTSAWTHDLKNGIRKAFAGVWQEVITEDVIAGIMSRDGELLKQCALLNLRMKEVSRLIAQLQAEDSGETEDI